MHFPSRWAFVLTITHLVDCQVDLGSAKSYAVLAATTVTNTGPSVLNGDLGLFPGTSITGFPPGVAFGAIHVNDAVAQTAQNDALAAYNTAASQIPTSDLTGNDLGGLVLGPGVYTFSSSAGLTGVLVLDGQGNANAAWIFQIGSTLITATSSTVLLTNGAQACNVIWQVGSSATLATGSTFVGNIIALTSISVSASVVSNGGFFALNGAITLISDTIGAAAGCTTALPSSIISSSTSSNLPLPSSGSSTNSASGSVDSVIPSSTISPIGAVISTSTSSVTSGVTGAIPTTSASSATSISSDSSSDTTILGSSITASSLSSSGSFVTSTSSSRLISSSNQGNSTSMSTSMSTTTPSSSSRSYTGSCTSNSSSCVYSTVSVSPQQLTTTSTTPHSKAWITWPTRRPTISHEGPGSIGTTTREATQEGAACTRRRRVWGIRN